MFLENNLKGLCDTHGLKYQDFLSDMDVDDVNELTLFDLTAICEEYELDLQSLLFKTIFKTHIWKAKLENIKLLILDVDGVLTDGGMYVTENGDQMKKFNTKDGMAILHLTKKEFQVGIVSSGFKDGLIQERAKLLGIQNCYVGREPKMDIISQWCMNLKIEPKNIAIIGDDINDLGVIRKVGFSAAPADAVSLVKGAVDVVLNTKGGMGCVREFIDNYLLSQPIE
jgi:YrbI family 3-deoxy-D-manno-octulosonate 8-phosphate phosphatase